MPAINSDLDELFYSPSEQLPLKMLVLNRIPQPHIKHFSDIKDLTDHSIHKFHELYNYVDMSDFMQSSLRIALRLRCNVCCVSVTFASL